ncbi:hypothetical protein LMH87_002745 [Akanthomyces muscarius]|uniref:Uncharacterized protein n=1 Tax=Akanthomyces muscarius TaxID=2231603 RepID=A0A9W8UHB8_AKAMU|nr:hypothetical protein LMH87_002745 [Akanthomyces muscarius]KAJ4148266.1 hypothetical protein LMH87_002745 [Akanthomyces muscarius]
MILKTVSDRQTELAHDRSEKCTIASLTYRINTYLNATLANISDILPDLTCARFLKKELASKVRGSCQYAGKQRKGQKPSRENLSLDTGIAFNRRTHRNLTVKILKKAG